nr:MAG TPA: capsid [Picobirnaviridae sp.]
MGKKFDESMKSKQYATKNGKGKVNQNKNIRDPKSKNNDCQDPFWYGKDTTAIKDMASFPWLEVVGSRIPGTVYDAVPGLMCLSYRHAITTNASHDGTFNNSFGNYATRAARAYYNYVVQGYSSTVSFEAPDLLLASLAAASLRAFMLEGYRAYTVLSYYLMTNNYYAKSIVQGLGFDYDDFIANKAKFRAEYNVRVRAMNTTLVIPKRFFISDRWDFIASNLFSDTSSPEYSSMLAYVNRACLQFNATDLKYGTGLKWVKTTGANAGLTVDQFFKIVDSLLDALNDDDVRSMFASMLRVYNVADLKYLAEIQEESPQMPLYRNDIVAATFHNAIWCASGVEASGTYATVPAAYTLSGVISTDFPVYQDENGNILSCLQASFGSVSAEVHAANRGAQSQILLDMYDHLVTPENVLDITSSMQCYQRATTSEYYVYCRSELITGLWVLGDFSTTGEASNVLLNGVNDVWDGATYWPFLAVTHIDSFPLLPFEYSAGSPGEIAGFVGEIDKYTTIPNNTLAKLHDRCLFNMLMMPENTRSIT